VTFTALSSVQNSYVMNEGESRQIQQRPILTTQLTLTGSGDAGTHVSVYNIPHHCPRLNGPQVILEDSRIVTLEEDEYQYDYFYLNAGSYIFLDEMAAQGMANLYIVKGAQVLDRVEGDSHEDESDFSRIAQRRRFVSRDDRTPISESYHVSKSDVYMLIYENASSYTSQLNIHFKVVLSTYNLAGKMPVCQLASIQDECRIHLHFLHRNCVLVQASSPSGAFSEKVVHVEAKSRRNWCVILLLSCLPLLWTLLPWIMWHRPTEYERIPEAACIPSSTTSSAPPMSYNATGGGDEEINVEPQVVATAMPVFDDDTAEYTQWPLAQAVEPLPVPMAPATYKHY
jgi:hypothetical protein